MQGLRRMVDCRDLGQVFERELPVITPDAGSTAMTGAQFEASRIVLQSVGLGTVTPGKHA